MAISGTLLRDENGAEDGTIGFAKDLREILKKDQLATLGEVAIGLSHEINNPLAVVLNQTEMLEKDLVRLAGEADTSVETERLDSMRREIGRISEVVERLSPDGRGGAVLDHRVTSAPPRCSTCASAGTRWATSA